MSRLGPSEPVPSAGRRRSLLALGVACGMATLIAVVYRLPRLPAWASWSREPDVPMYEVEESTFVHEVSAQGNLRASRSVVVGVPPGVPSPLKIAWTCPDGSAVRKGDVVVRFEPTDFEKRLLDGQDDRASAQAKADKERELAALAERTRERSATLSALELTKAREFQARDPEIFSRNQIIESGIDEQLSAARRDYAAEARQIEASVSKNKVQQIAVEQRQAELSIARADKGLRSLELRAPEDGVILFERDWMGTVMKVGDTVWEGKTIASLPVLEQMEAEVFVLEADAGGLKVGKPAHVVLESHPDQTYEATIASIDTLAKRPRNGVSTQYFGVILAFEKTRADETESGKTESGKIESGKIESEKIESEKIESEKIESAKIESAKIESAKIESAKIEPRWMKPGGRVTARLVLDSQRALSVPRHAVFEREGRSVVYRHRDGHFEPVLVQLGATTPGRVVIAAGLNAGDEIALADPSARSDGHGGESQGQAEKQGKAERPL
jgi:multidrug efflux pump subunit AcrA (membrane-fusion protein)